jgi:hypothetical protein
MTELQINTLKYLQRNPGALVSGLPDVLVPRGIYGWTAQGAARMGGKLVAALKRQGLVNVKAADCGVGCAYLTADGEKLLKEPS